MYLTILYGFLYITTRNAEFGDVYVNVYIKTLIYVLEKTKNKNTQIN